MRLPETQIKQALLHPTKLVREQALQYFADCHSRDIEVMPLAIAAIEKYGRSEAFWSVTNLAHLAQSEATLAWTVRELNRETEDEEFDCYRFFPALSALVCRAAPSLIVPFGDEIRNTCGFDEGWFEYFEERARMALWDADRCWQELESLAVKGDDEMEFDFDRASLVVDLLAPQGEKYAPRILELLGKTFEEHENEPLLNLESKIVQLAGEMRLAAAIPLIVEKMHRIDDPDDSDEDLEHACGEALAKISSDATALALTADYLKFDPNYRFMAACTLEKVHADTTVPRCLELLPQEPELDMRTVLASAILCQYDAESLGPVLEMVRQVNYNEDMEDLMRKVVAVCRVLGATFPELDAWESEAIERREEVEENMHDEWLVGDMDEDDYFTNEMEDEDHIDTDDIEGPAPPPVFGSGNARGDFYSPQVPFVHAEKQVGRNDPCPCGSGKKFKKCCLKDN